MLFHASILVMFVLTLCACFLLTHGLNPYPRIVSRNVTGNIGDPVYLTKYIENGDLEGGRRASYVRPFLNNIESYSGFFTVNKLYNSNIFFWFFPAEKNKENAPVVVWLQGGPGASSLIGLFNENGVYYIDKNNNLKIRDYYWSQIANIIYIDNPVGTGFSFTKNNSGYSTDQVQIGINLYETIIQFFTIFPDYLKNDFYIFGESYGGKYAPAMAYTIHKKNQGSAYKIELKGMGNGNGFTDPPNMLLYDKYLYTIGLIDNNGKEKFKEEQNCIINATQKRYYKTAGKMLNQLIINETDSLFYKETGFRSHFNYLHANNDSIYGNFGKFLEDKNVRKNLHVGNLSFFDSSPIVMDILEEDLMKTVILWFKTLLENYKILVYNGQLDIICAYPMTVNYLKKLDWKGAEEYKIAKRNKWYVDNKLAGYVKQVEGLTEVLVRNAGHMVPQDQPKWAFNLFKIFVFNQPF